MGECDDRHLGRQPDDQGKLRPEGSQGEGYFHTRWAEPFDVSEWLVAWPTAFRLEVLRRVGMEAVEKH